MKRLISFGLPVALSILFAPLPAAADEGMWLPDAPPRDELRSRYGFTPTEAWLDHMRKSCVKIGASGSFVSPHGLVLTNHHVGAGQLEKLSTPEHNFLEDGFLARTLDEEIKCPDMEALVLWEQNDVTARIEDAVTPEMTPGQAEDARRRRMTEVEEESEKATGLKSHVVKLYRGERYHLYRYKRYTDIRLVMAPARATAFFGGDNDNFEYPRFDLDICFFRVYENGRPLEVENYLKVSETGAKEGDLALVFGHPGRTNRLCTVEDLRFQRDVELPAVLSWIRRREVELAAFMARNPENRRIGSQSFFNIQNSRKARTGYLAALQDPAVMAAKRQDETSLRAWVAADPQRQERWGDAWDSIASACGAYRTFFDRQQVLDGRAGGSSTLFETARTLVRLAEELPKPSRDRLREYTDSNLSSLYLRLYSSAPVYPALEVDRVASWLAYAVETLGGDDPAVATLLDGQSPEDRAQSLVRGSKLADVTERKRLAKGGAAAIEASDDSMIRLAAAIDPEARALRRRYETEVEGVETEAYAKIAAAQFKFSGESTYPDATGTLRVAFGAIEGYEEGGRRVPAFTTFRGLYQRYDERKGQPGFELPPRWFENKGRLDLDTPLDFVCTADIIGGNSGSPVVNRDGDLIGVVFDGNIESLVWNYIYSDTRARAIAVDARAILAALRNVYGAGALADEMESK